MDAWRMYMRLCLIIAIAIFLFASGVERGFAKASTEQFVPGQIVVKLDPATDATIADINVSYGTTTIKALAETAGVYLLQAPAGASVADLVSLLDVDVRLLYAEPNLFGQVVEGVGVSRWARAGSDPMVVRQQYANQMLNLATAHTLSTGANTVVAVIDTGMQLNHPALAANLTQVRYDFLDNDTTPTEDFAQVDPDGDGFANELAGHATFVAEIVLQVAPDVRIMPLRVMDSNGIGNEFAVAEAIHFAVAHGANVINLSLGTPVKSDLLKDVVKQVVENTQVVVVAAAGNDNSSQELWPAASSYAVAVTGVGATKQKSPFANYGSWVDIAAPAEDVVSAFPINKFAAWSGTSFATPFVAGQAALLHSRYPTLSNSKLRQLMVKTAQPLAAELGAGLLDIVASLQSTKATNEALVNGADLHEQPATSRLFLTQIIR